MILPDEIDIPFQEDLRRRTRKNIRARKIAIYLSKTICQKSNLEI